MARSRGTSDSVTIAEVSKVAGVAPMTVSRYLNKHPNVTEKTARKVRDAIDSLGYTPNHAARVLMGQPSNVIGLVVPNLADPFYSTLARSAEEVARQRGCLVWIASSNGDPATESVVISQMRRHHVDGILLIPTPGGDIASVTSGKAPLVAIDRPLPGLAVDAVIVDNRRAAREAVEHLIGHGARRIACLGFDGGLFSIEERIGGYEDAMRHHGLQSIVNRECRTVHKTVDILRQLKRGKQAVDAVFSLNNVTTVHLLEVIEELGIDVPSEMALIGFDDFELAPLMRPPVTVVRQPVAGLGSQAARLLFDRLDQSPNASAYTISLPTSLIVRESCGCGAARTSASFRARRA